jgi:hypothetical protein
MLEQQQAFDVQPARVTLHCVERRQHVQCCNTAVALQ